METFLTAVLMIVDTLKSPTAKDYYAGLATIVLAVLTAELILGMF